MAIKNWKREGNLAWKNKMTAKLLEMHSKGELFVVTGMTYAATPETIFKTRKEALTAMRNYMEKHRW